MSPCASRRVARRRVLAEAAVMLLTATVMFAVAGTAGAKNATTASTGNAIPGPLPTPRPADFDASGTVSAFPAPGTPTASPTTTITFRGPGASDLAIVQVTGSQSGAHPGHVQPQADGLGSTFAPDAAFTPGETVTVSNGLSVRGANNGLYSFTVATPSPFPDDRLPSLKPTSRQDPANDLLHFVTRPDLTPPNVKVTTQPKDTAPGDVFLTPVGGDAQPGLVILDNEGQPLWSSPATGARRINLAVQTYRGQPVLTWYEGSVVDPGVGQGTYVIADSTYHQVARISAVNGYAADIHDMTITPQDTALLQIYSPVIVDASSVHGRKRQRVLEPVIQEIDIATGALRFEWHGLSAIPLKDSYQPVPKKSSDTFDYVHPNSIDVDHDGDLLLSGRHTSTVYKIDRVGGALDWRLGGKEDSFTIAKSAEPAWQHDARPEPDGILTIFDNGAAGQTVTHKTRGLVLRLDEQAMTASLVRQYPLPGKAESTSQGSMRLQPNGDYFVGWGDQPEYTEFASDATVVYDVQLPSSSAGTITSYRALRFPWSGHPTDLPAVAAKRTNGDEMTVFVSWNGATDVGSWTVLAGPDYAHLVPVTSAPREGFETAIHTTSNQPYYAVQALDASGNVLATSGPMSPRS